MMNFILMKNRNLNLLAQGKCSSFNPDEIPTMIQKASFEYKMRDKYNHLPRGITLAPTIMNFKKWIHKYQEMSEFECYPLRKDYNFTLSPVISHQVIHYCMMARD